MSIEKIEESSNTIEQEERIRFEYTNEELTGIDAEKLDPQEYSLARELQRPAGKAGLTVAAALAPSVGRVVLRSLKRLVQGTHHGWRATLCEEVLTELGGRTLGKPLWENMKKRAAELFAGTDAVSPSAAGVRLLAEMERLQKDNPNVDIDVCCHSAGAIVMCHMLMSIAVSQRRVKLRHLIFLAPACTARLFHDTVLAHRTLFSHAYLFNMTDEYEQRDPIALTIYPRSLLYLVSGLLEDAPATPLLGMARFFDNKRIEGSEILRIIAKFFDGTGQGTFILSPTGSGEEPGRRSEAIQHGAFDDDDTTLKSLVHIISQ